VIHDELWEMIKAGWGNVNQSLIPPDWRTRKPPRNVNAKYMEDAIEDARSAALMAKRKRCAERRRELKRLRQEQLGVSRENPKTLRRGAIAKTAGAS